MSCFLVHKVSNLLIKKRKEKKVSNLVVGLLEHNFIDEDGMNKQKQIQAPLT